MANNYKLLVFSKLLAIFAAKFGLTSGENRVCYSKSIILNTNKWKL